jgi:flagellar hook protein FlgE
MSLFNTLNTGASGLSASGLGLSVIGDNIANLNSFGFKRTRASFADVFPSSVGTLGGVKKMGNGATTSNVSTMFEQGMLSGTGSALDVALTGQGFFQVGDGQQNYYTRDGSFTLDNSDYLVTAGGLRVQGYQATNGVIGNTVGDIQLDTGAFPPQASSEITIDAVFGTSVDFDPALPTQDYEAIMGSLDGITNDLNTASDLADFSTSLTVYDSMGRPHDVVVNFEQISENPAPGGTDWVYSVVIDGGETDVAGALPGMALQIESGTLSFDQFGELTNQVADPSLAGWTWPGADPFSPAIDFGFDAITGLSDGSLLVGGEDPGLSSVTAISQDGFSVGSLTSLVVDPDGTVRGQYTNGEERALGQVGIATFGAEGGLERLGSNLFQATLASGDPAMGAAGSGSRGSVNGYALERSNVDLEDEFVAMIQTQRSYQANAGVVRTADETLQELVNLV